MCYTTYDKLTTITINPQFSDAIKLLKLVFLFLIIFISENSQKSVQKQINQYATIHKY